MAGRKLARYVTALDDDGRMVTFEPGTTVSEKVAEGITNPKAWEAADDDSTADADDSDVPAGNASLEDWQEYARSQGATDADLEDKSRNDLRDEFGTK